MLLAGAEPGTEEMPIRTALTIMKFMNVERKSVRVVCFMKSNEMAAREDAEAMMAVRAAAEALCASAAR